MLYLIRHADAEPRRVDGKDRYRCLTPKGTDRSHELSALPLLRNVAMVLSSPATRCLQTVGPLAKSLGVEVFEVDELIEGSSVGPAMAFLTEIVTNLSDHPTTDTVVCSHGDLIPLVVEQLSKQAVRVEGRGCEKGSIWAIDHDGSDWKSAKYVGLKSEVPDSR